MDELDKILNTVESKEINEIVGEVLNSADFDVKREVSYRLPYTRKASVNDIVPEEYQQKLMEIDFTMSQCYWLIGDICTDLVNSVNRTRARELGKIISKTDIFEAVGFFCHRTSRSVRYYYECAWFFPVEVRQKYEVPFNIYAEARWVKDWELLLQIAEENPIWSAERVRNEYLERTGEKKESRESGSADSGAEMPADEEENLSEVASAEGYRKVILSELEKTIDKLRQVLDRIPLPTEIRKRIGDVLYEIQDIDMEIRREM
jgi:hypothetical protein